MGFIDTMRSQGHAVESICRVLREQGCQIAARTYRSWKRAGRVIAARTVSDAHVVDAVRDIAWKTKLDSDGVVVRKLSPEGLYGRRKMTAYLRRTVIPEASAGSVDRAMRTLGLSGVRRDKGTRTAIPAKDGIRAGDLLDRDFTAAAPNRTWVTDFTYVRTWAGFTYVAFIVDVYVQRIVAWHAATTKHTDLVMDPVADGTVAAGPRGQPEDRRRAGSSLGRRVAIYESAADRARWSRCTSMLSRHETSAQLKHSSSRRPSKPGSQSEPKSRTSRLARSIQTPHRLATPRSP